MMMYIGSEEEGKGGRGGVGGDGGGGGKYKQKDKNGVLRSIRESW